MYVVGKLFQQKEGRLRRTIVCILHDIASLAAAVALI
jgi:hypothetical protein